MADKLTGTLKLETGQRWWFHIARTVTMALIMMGIVKDIDRAAQWLAAHGVWYRAYIETGEGRVNL